LIRKKWLGLFLMVVCVGMVTVAYADDPNPPFVLNGTSYPTVNVMTDGQPMVFDTPAVLINNRTMVPLRFVSESLGGNVVWDPNSKSVLVTMTSPLALPPVTLPQLAGTADHGNFDGFPIVDVYVNGNKVTGDTPAMIFNNRTMVPLRFVSQALGSQVNWDPGSYTAFITKPDTAPRSLPLPENPSVLGSGLQSTLGSTGNLTGNASNPLGNAGNLLGTVTGALACTPLGTLTNSLTGALNGSSASSGTCTGTGGESLGTVTGILGGLLPGL
jgi:hypothetical protein